MSPAPPPFELETQAPVFSLDYNQRPTWPFLHQSAEIQPAWADISLGPPSSSLAPLRTSGRSGFPCLHAEQVHTWERVCAHTCRCVWSGTDQQDTWLSPLSCSSSGVRGSLSPEWSWILGPSPLFGHNLHFRLGPGWLHRGEGRPRRGLYGYGGQIGTENTGHMEMFDSR